MAVGTTQSPIPFCSLFTSLLYMLDWIQPHLDLNEVVTSYSSNINTEVTVSLQWLPCDQAPRSLLYFSLTILSICYSPSRLPHGSKWQLDFQSLEAMIQGGNEGMEKRAMAHFSRESVHPRELSQNALPKYKLYFSGQSQLQGKFRNQWHVAGPNNIRICLGGRVGGWALGRRSATSREIGIVDPSKDTDLLHQLTQLHVYLSVVFY